MKYEQERVRDLKSGEKGRELCRQATACDGYRYIHNYAAIYRVRPHAMATERTLARLFA